MRKNLPKNVVKKINISPTDPNFVKIGPASKALGVSIDTLRRWEKTGKITSIRTPGGTRLYSLSSLPEVNPAVNLTTETYQTTPISTEELLNKAAHQQSQDPPWNIEPANPPFEPLPPTITPESTQLAKGVFVSKSLLAKAALSFFSFTLIITALAGLMSLRNASVTKQPAAVNSEVSSNNQPLADNLPAGRQVLAVATSAEFLEVNSPVQVNGSLFVRDCINGISLEATPSAASSSAGCKPLLDQSVSISATPTFAGLKLSDKKDQLVFQSGGPAGTITWTPTAARTITLPDVTTTLVGIDNAQTLTNKSISGSTNTLTNIPNSALTNAKITITAGDNLTGGGEIALGESKTISLKDSPTITGTLTVSGATILNSTLTTSGATILSSTLTVTGATVLGSTLAVNGASLTSNQSTFNLLSTNVSTLNIGDVASTLNLAGGSGSTGCTVDSSGNMSCTGNITGSSSGTAGFWGRTGALTYLSNFADNLGIGTSTQYGTARTFIQGNGTGTNITLQTTGSNLTQGLTVLDNGNVGIGTTNPVGLFQVGSSATAPNLFVSTGGNVGIGTSVPAALLGVNGLVDIGGSRNGINFGATPKLYVAGGNIIMDNNQAFMWRNAAGNSNRQVFNYNASEQLIINPSSSGMSFTPDAIERALMNNTTFYVTRNQNVGAIFQGSDTTTDVTIDNSGITLASGKLLTWTTGAIDTSGNVGIGTSVPGSKLQVNGGGVVGFGAAPIVAPTNGLAVSGNVGIGTTTANYNLSVVGTANITGNLSLGSQLQLANGTAAAPAYSFTNLTNAGLWTNGDGLLLTTGGSDTKGVTVTGSGNVGIGTTNPNTKLTIKGSADGTDVFNIVDENNNYRLKYTQLAAGSTKLSALSGFEISAGSGSATSYLASPYHELYFDGGTGLRLKTLANNIPITVQTNGSGSLTLDSGTTGAINIGTGANAKTVTIGNATGATALAFTSGTGSQTFTSSNATGATTASSWVFNDAALTTGTGAYFTSSTLTTGKLVDISNTSNTQTTGTMFNISSTATSLTTGSLAMLDWSPGSVQSTAATGNLFNINIGANASNFAGNLFNIADSGSSIFSISKSAVTTSLPVNITAPGDMSVAYDIQLTNPTASYIKSASALILQAGEVFNSADLTLKTYNQGSVILDSAVTTGNALDMTNNTVTTGNNLLLSADALTTGNAVNITSTSTAGGASGSSYLLNLSRSGANASASHTAYGLYSAVTNTNATSGTNIAGYFSASGATTANYAAIFANGNVGIGTTAPGAGIEVATAGAASKPGELLSGAWYTGGSSTTTKPQLLVEPTGTTSTGWSTSGTGLGINAASGFTGNLIDLQANGTREFNVDYNGLANARGGFTTNNWATFPNGLSSGVRFATSNGSTITGGEFGIALNFSIGSFNNIGSEINGYKFAGNTTTIAGGFATQRFSLFAQPTITAGSALNISSEASTMNIAGAPISAGSATIANAYGLKIDSGTSVATGVTNAYGLYVAAPTGATNNYAAAFMGGNVGIGTTAPAAQLDMTGPLKITYGTTQGPTSPIPLTIEHTASAWDTLATFKWRSTVGQAYGKTLSIKQDNSGFSSMYIDVTGGALLLQSATGVKFRSQEVDMPFFYANSATTGVSLGATYGNIAAPTSGLIVEGNVGIGTSSPTSALTVIGNGSFTGNVGVGGSLTSTSSIFNLLSSNVSTLNIGDATTTLNLAGGSGSTGCTVDSSGNMTCTGNITGSSSGTAGFWGRTGALTYLSNFADNLGIGTSTQYGTARTFIQGNGTGTNITLQTTGSNLTQGLTVLDNGNVGIGTTSPAGILHVAGQCVTGDTLLKRRRRRKGKNGEWIDEWEDVRIDEIEPGDEILTLDEKTGEFVVSKVKALQDMGMQQTYLLVTEFGKHIRTTSEHPYFIRNPRWIKPPIIPTRIVGSFEVDLSGHIEDTAVSTIVSIANAGFYANIIITPNIKKKLKKYFKKRGHLKYLGPRVFASAIIKIIKQANLTPGQLKIDLEYPGYLQEIDYILNRFYPDIIVAFGSVGKHSPAHFAAYGAAKGKLGLIGFLNEEDIVGIRKDRDSKRNQGDAQDQDHHTLEKLPDQVTIARGLKLNKLYLEPLDLSNGDWVKVKNIKEGLEVATTDGWERIVSITPITEEKVYDIEVENTHNFVGNNIVAHNTAIFGAGEAGTPTTTTLRGAAGAGTNIAGANFTFDASNGTGTGGSGALIFRTAPTGSTGSVANTLAEIMRITPGGNVGIGTAAPGMKVSFGTSVPNAKRIIGIYETGNSGSGIGMDAADSSMRIYADTAQARLLNIGTYTTDGAYTWSPKVTVDIAGNVGIGTATPAGLLHVAGQCVTGDTLLKRRRRRKNSKGEWEDYFEDIPIKNIRPGDEILTLDERSGRLVVSKVKQLMDMGVKQIFELTTATGKKIRTTANHPYLVAPKIKKPKVAVFIDAANFEVSLRSLGVTADYGKFEEALGGKIVSKNYYSVDFADSKQDKLFSYLKHHNYHLVTKPLKLIRRRGSKDASHKANLDVEITFDSVLNVKSFDTMVLFSGDSDFVYLTQGLQKLGKKVVVISPNFRTAKELKTTADLFIDLRNMPFLRGVDEAVKDTKKGPLWAHKDNLMQTAKAILTQVAPFVKGGKWVKVKDFTDKMMIATVSENRKTVFEKVLFVEARNQEQVFDIEVENTHNFVGNDIVAHNTAIFGAGEGGTPTTTTLRGAAAAGTNIAGANFTFDASNGTGTGGSGALIFRTAPTGSTGSVANTLAEIMRITPGGNVGIGTTAPVAGLENATAGAASKPGGLLSGTWFTGGTATTTKPQLLIEPTGTTSTGWSTSGTGLGINSATGFIGNALDIQQNGSAKFAVRFDGLITSQNSIQIQGTLATGSGLHDIRGTINNNAGILSLQTRALSGSTETGALTLGGNTLTVSSGYATQRFTLFSQPTITAASALNISSEASTLNIAGAPISAGSATIANSYGLKIASGTSVASGVTNAYGMFVDAPTGATNNYAAVFNTGNVGIGTTSPGASLQINSSSASVIPAIIQGASSQSSNFFSVQQSTGNQLFGIESDGTINSNGLPGNNWLRIKQAGSKVLGVLNQGSIPGTSISGPQITLGTGSNQAALFSDDSNSGLSNLIFVTRSTKIWDWTPTTTPTVATGVLFDINSQNWSSGTTGGHTLLRLKGGTYTNQNAGVEINDFLLDGSRSITWNTGSLSSQRTALITPPTLAFVGASTVTDASTLSISGSPVAGTNATITSSSGLRISSNNVASGVTNAYGMFVDAPTGATNNYAAVFNTGNVGIGTTAPTLGKLQVYDGNLVFNGATNSDDRKVYSYFDAGSLTLQSGTNSPTSITLRGPNHGTSAGIIFSSINGVNTSFDFSSSSVTSGTGIGGAFNGLTTGNAVNITSTSTAGGASGASYLLNLSRSGANANTAHTAYGLYSNVTNTNATSSTNIAGYFSASGATTANYAAIFANGNVGIGTTSPAAKLDLYTDPTTGNGMLITANNLTSGNALKITTSSAGFPTSGGLLNVSAIQDYGASSTYSGNVATISRSASIQPGGATLNVTGSVLAVTDNCRLLAAATCTHSGNVLSLTQSWASATGAVLAVTNSGAGPAATFNSGNVGIGTTSPTASLEVRGSSASIRVTNSSGAGGIITTSGNNLSLNTIGSDTVALGSNVTEFDVVGKPIATRGGGTIPFLVDVGGTGTQAMKLKAGTLATLELTQAHLDLQDHTIYGGSGVSSALTLAGTSNASPSNAKIILNGSGQGNVGIGTTAPVAGLEVATAGAASKPGGLLSGTWFSGGTSTTTKPQLLVEPTGTTSTAWSTNGTGFGINAASGFTGNLIDAQLAGTSKFKVTSAGATTVTNTFNIFSSASGNTMSITPTINGLNLNNSAGTSRFNFVDSTSTNRFTFVPANINTAVGNEPDYMFNSSTLTLNFNPTLQTFFHISQPTITADFSSRTVTNLATFYIANAPAISATGGGTPTVTNNYALWVAGGTSRFDGSTAIFGAGEAGTPTATTIRGAAAAGTNIAGANLTLDASNGTGTGGSGALIFRTAPAGSTGSTANTLAEIMRITPSGNVGIGTTNPGALLDILGPTDTTILKVKPAINPTSTTKLFDVQRQDGSTIFNVQGTGAQVMQNLSATTGTLILNGAGSEGIRISSTGVTFFTPITSLTTNQDLKIQPNGIGNTYLNYSGGNVGIGTTAPISKLQLSDTSVTTGTSFVINPGTAMTTGGAFGISSATYVHGAAETGSLASLSFSDTSSAVFTTTTNGLLLSPTINTTGAATRTFNGINISPTLTACGTTGGTCTLNNELHSTPALTQSTTNTFNINGINLSTAGALVQNTAAGTINWTGANIQMPNITQTTGTVTSTGLKITGGTVTSGTSYGLIVDSNAGNVGIGTTSPLSKLDTVFSSTSTSEAVANGMTIANSDTTVNNLESLYFGSTASDANRYAMAGISAKNIDHTLASLKADLIFSTRQNPGFTEVMRLTSGGNVGIGTTAPGLLAASNFKYLTISSAGSGGAVLEGQLATATSVQDGSLFNIDAYNGSTRVVDIAMGGDGSATSGNLTFWTKPTSTTLTERMRITSNGNVGIGTITPGANLDLSASYTSATAGNKYANRIIMSNTGAIASGIDNTYGQYISSTKSGATAGSISNWGQYITTVSSAVGASYGIDINNDAGATTNYGLRSVVSGSQTGTTVYGIHSTVNATTSSTAYALYADAGTGAGTEYAGIFINGNVGIGTTAPGFKLEVNGSMGIDNPTVSTTGDYLCWNTTTHEVEAGTTCTLSSEKFKTDIAPLSSLGLKQVMALNPVSFRFKEGYGDNGSTTQLGFIAEQAALVDPRLVTFDPKGNPNGFVYANFTSVLTRAIQEQQAQIASQSAILTNISLDADGNVNMPKVKLDKLLLTDSRLTVNGTTNSLLAYDFGSTGSIDPNNGTGVGNGGSVDVLASLKNLDQNLIDLKSKQATDSANIAGIQSDIASQSAEIANAKSQTSSLAQQLASAAADLAQTKSKVDGLNLTPPETLYATGSAQLATLSVASEATVSGMLTAYQAQIQDHFKVFGETTLAKTTIAGDLTVDGTLSIENGSELNVIGTLYLQKSILADKVDLFGGKVVVDKNGYIQAQALNVASVVTNKLTILGAPARNASASVAGGSIGTATLPANQTKITINTTEATSSAKMFVTPTTPTDKVLSVTNIVNGQSFDVSTLTSSPSNITFNWWIIGTQ